MAARRWLGVAAAALVALAAGLVPVPVDAALKLSGDSRVKFIAAGNRGVRVVGRTRTLWVSDTQSVITLMVPVESLHTGIGLRDKHMRDRYLHASRYPTIRLDVPWAGVRRPPPGGTVVAEADGTLHLHGQARSLRFRYTAREEGGVISVDATFRIDIRDFGVEPPSFLGIHVFPQVDAEARFQVSESR